MARYAPKDFDLAEHRQRARDAWAIKQSWQYLYDECYTYAIPYRGPGNKWGPGSARSIDNLFDDTAISSTFHGAGALKEDLFPSGQAWFKYDSGPLALIMAKQQGRNAAEFQQQIEAVSDQIMPFFQTGEFDQAATEMCIDLYAGTGCILPLEGDDALNPVRFIAISTDEIAVESGPYNDIAGVYWATTQTRRQIFKAFPKGNFPLEFMEAMRGDGANTKIKIHQDFTAKGNRGRWCLVVHLEGYDNVIAYEEYRTQPIIVSRYHRVPGESYGRGPIMLALPAIKTSNKAQELTLKAFAINMLGIWGYRPGGAFNPDTARIAPGEMWAMTSTGGVLGPDVMRMDPATGNVNMASLVSTNLTDRIRATLNDDRASSDGKTPVSATEYAGELAKLKQNYIGAFGRLIHEIVPPIVRRVAEILYKKGILKTDLTPDQLLIQVKVLSPLANTVKMSHVQPFMQYLQLLAGMQQNPNRFVDVDQAMDDIYADMDLPAKWHRTVEQRQQIDQQAAQQQATDTVTSALANKPDVALQLLQGGKAKEAAAP